MAMQTYIDSAMGTHDFTNPDPTGEPAGVCHRCGQPFLICQHMAEASYTTCEDLQKLKKVMNKPPEPSPEIKQRIRVNKYARFVRDCGDPAKTATVDVYSVCDAYQLDHKLAHVVKKLLAPGQRSGGKSFLKDLEEAAWTLDRYIRDYKAASGQGIVE